MLRLSIGRHRPVGVLGMPGFFSPSICRSLRDETRSGDLAPARVRAGDAGTHVDREHRRSHVSRVSPRAHAVVNDALRRVQPWISNHFQLWLGGFEEAQFLLYHPGDFFGGHADGPVPAEYPFRPNCRKISVIVFLNGEVGSAPDSSFTGGALSFLEEGTAGSAGLPITPAEGLLVAFPAYLGHEVLPVRHGDRFTVVSWYY